MSFIKVPGFFFFLAPLSNPLSLGHETPVMGPCGDVLINFAQNPWHILLDLGPNDPVIIVAIGKEEKLENLPG